MPWLRTCWNLGEMQRKPMMCTWGIGKLCMWTGSKHIRKQFPGYRKSAGWHCSDTGRGAYQGHYGAKMQFGDGEVWVKGVAWVPSKAFSSPLEDVWRLISIQEVICDIYDGLASMCLKVVLGTKCQRSRFRDKGSMVERMLIPCNKTVNLIDLLS